MNQHQKISFAETLVERESESFGEPVGVAGHDREHDRSDDHIMEVGDQEKAVVNDEIDWRNCKQNAGQAADHEGNHEPDRDSASGREPHAPAVHREHPVEDLHTGWNRDDHARNAEYRVDVRARAHGEEMVQPDHERDDADGERRKDHRAITEQRLAREG